jgi:hypothetical protein
MLVAVPAPARPAFPGRFVVARAQARPGRQVGGVREVPGDVRADLGDDRGRGQRAYWLAFSLTLDDDAAPGTAPELPATAVASTCWPTCNDFALDTGLALPLEDTITRGSDHRPRPCPRPSPGL